jgi:hypothetical protein
MRLDVLIFDLIPAREMTLFKGAWMAVEMAHVSIRLVKYILDKFRSREKSCHVSGDTYISARADIKI